MFNNKKQSSPVEKDESLVDLMNKYEWNLKRLRDISNAIVINVDANKEIPTSWLTEQREIISYLLSPIF